ncbi:MAG: pseudouridine-5'-phosphate glycosidase [Anaerolineales bacterium]|nr:pseudouridine-5'-phosphate glycosidase [Anaerolineales bacterium]
MTPIQIHPEVADALAERRPVVAMESTLITHGLPYPHNLDVAHQMETAVRDEGAVPATVAILQGKIHVGLSEDQLIYLAGQRPEAIRRCSRRNLPIVLARKEDGSTTVAGTMIVAHLAGIELFATGGIGGVHRGHPFDVSADLMELGRTPVTVVCSGMKPFLDLAATREVLETQGVTLVGYGTDDVAPFFTTHSGQKSDVVVETPADVAALVQARRELALQSGTLVSVPVPDMHQYDRDMVNEAIDAAILDADAQGVAGAAVTSWMVRRLAAVLGPDTFRANIQLLCYNAKIAAQIGQALNRLNL